MVRHDSIMNGALPRKCNMRHALIIKELYHNHGNPKPMSMKHDSIFHLFSHKQSTLHLIYSKDKTTAYLNINKKINGQHTKFQIISINSQQVSQHELSVTSAQIGEE